MRRVYFISGLGADWRAFSLLDLSFCEPVFVDWIEPRHAESLKDYAMRLREQIQETHPAIVGVSFGGMLATEMAKADPQIEAVIIASNKSAREFPPYLRIGKYFPIYKWIPDFLMKKASIFTWILGPKGKEQEQLLKSIIRDMNPRFLKWAISAILDWKESDIPPNVRHIHGTRDRLLLCRYVKPDYEIKGGTHLVSMNMPEEVSKLLRELFREAQSK